MVRRHREALRGLNRRCGGFGMRQEKPRQAPGERRLADAFGPADDPRLRHLVAAVGVEKFMLRLSMSEKRQSLPRMRASS